MPNTKWGTVELAYGKPREVLDKKKDRGSGKVVNFCISGTSLVDCYRDGQFVQVPIKDVLITDLVWDGDNWVSHKGISYSGKQTVHNYLGLWATDNHMVWTKEGDVITFGEARRKHIELKTHRVEETLEYENSSEERVVDCYDLLDAGPNKRFTCSGILVHNSSSYGGQAASIALKIEADTGIKPNIDDVQAMLDAIEQRQPRATIFFEELEKIPDTVGWMQANSGRIRHFHTIERGIEGTARTRSGQITALGREARNYF